MATLSIRNLPDHVHARLRTRAAKAGRSMEAEAREILAEAVRTGDVPVDGATLQRWVEHMYGGKKPRGVVDDLLVERRRESARE